MLKKIIFLSLFFILCCQYQHIFASEKNSNSSITPFLTITSNEIKLKTMPAQDAPNIKVKFPLLGKSFDIKAKHENWNKIIMEDGREGWIQKHHTQTLSNIQDIDYVMAMKEPSKIYKKALIINPLKGKGSNISTPIKYYSSSTLNGEPKGQIPIFKVLYLFNEDQQHHSYLLGRIDRFKKENSQNVLLGWINAKYVIFWNNKIGVEFDKNNYKERFSSCGLGKIYYSEQDLKNHVKPIYYENKSENFMPYYMNRFPLLDKFEHKDRVYYKILYICNAFIRDKVNTQQKTVAPDILKPSQTYDYGIGYVYKSECDQNQIVERVLMDRRYVQKLQTQASSLSNSIKYFDPENEESFQLTIYNDVVRFL